MNHVISCASNAHHKNNCWPNIPKYFVLNEIENDISWKPSNGKQSNEQDILHEDSLECILQLHILINNLVDVLKCLWSFNIFIMSHKPEFALLKLSMSRLSLMRFRETNSRNSIYHHLLESILSFLPKFICDEKDRKVSLIFWIIPSSLCEGVWNLFKLWPNWIAHWASCSMHSEEDNKIIGSWLWKYKVSGFVRKDLTRTAICQIQSHSYSLGDPKALLLCLNLVLQFWQE